jgi:hypothetical protein
MKIPWHEENLKKECYKVRRQKLKMSLENIMARPQTEGKMEKA